MIMMVASLLLLLAFALWNDQRSFWAEEEVESEFEKCLAVRRAGTLKRK